MQRDPKSEYGAQYKYVQNNPINNVDPSGKITIIVHGTNIMGKGTGKWWKPEGSFARNLDQITKDVWELQNAKGDQIKRVIHKPGNSPGQFELYEDGDYFLQTFQWSGRNEHTERVNASKRLAKLINSIKKDFPDEPINLIAHSHGGNVALNALTYLNDNVQIDNMILLANPFLVAGKATDDLEKVGQYPYLNPSQLGHVKRMTSFHSKEDSVQTTGVGNLPGLSQWLLEKYGSENIMGYPSLPPVKVESHRTFKFYGIDKEKFPYTDRYRSIHIKTDAGKIDAHSVLHSSKLGEAIGRYLKGREWEKELLKRSDVEIPIRPDLKRGRGK